MAGIRANTAWYACNEVSCGSPVRSAVFSVVSGYFQRYLAVRWTAVDGHRASGRPQCKRISDAVWCARAHVRCAHAVFTTI
eukprot:3355180-Prymnesium_polylepis.1